MLDCCVVSHWCVQLPPVSGALQVCTMPEAFTVTPYTFFVSLMYSPPGIPFKGMPLELKTMHAVPAIGPVRESFVQGEAWESPAVVLGGGTPTLPNPGVTPWDNEIAVG